VTDSDKNVTEHCYCNFQFKSNHHIVSWSKPEYMYMYRLLKLQQANIIMKAHLFKTTASV